MTALPISPVLALSLAVTLAGPVVIHGQATSELPRAEYYVARELFRVGRTIEATEGFKAALSRARRVGEQRWIDSVPPLVMLGECYYQQGSLALAMEQYDAALLLALGNPGWIDQIEVQLEQLPELDVSSKGINWFAKSRPTRSVAVPAGIQISIDPTQSQITPQGGVVAPVSLVTHLDATEVLRTMGIALMRRWEILGPLAQHSPLAAPLDAMFARNPMQQAPWVASSWNVLRGLSSLSSSNGRDGLNLVRSGMLIANQLDYYLSPLALLALGKWEAREGNYQAAIVTLQDAALLAAQFEQYGTLNDAIDWVASCAAASQRMDLIDPMQRLAAWANKKSGSVQVASLLASAELSVYGRNFAQADKLLKQAATLLRGREAALPRLQAQLAYLNALLAFGQNRGALGITHLDAGLKIMRGTAATGLVVESIFQAQMTLDLLAVNALTATDAEELLMESLAEPGKSDWELAPLKTIAALTTARIPAYERLLELAASRAAGDDAVLRQMDRLQRQRLYEALPLGGRLFAWRNAVGGNLQLLSPESRKVVATTLQSFPALTATLERIDSLVEQLRQGPMPLDERKLSPDAKKAFSELEELSANLESQLAFHSLLRRPLDRFVPPAASLEKTRNLLSDGDLVLGLVVTSRTLFGVAIAKNAIHFWQVNELDPVNSHFDSLLAQIGLFRKGDGNTASDAAGPVAAWRKSSELLASSLFPGEVQVMLGHAVRVIVVPNERLWYVPYELLSLSAAAGGGSWIAHHAVTYAPTLGNIDLAFGTRPVVKDTVGIVGNLFSIDSADNLEQAQGILRAVPDSHPLILAQKTAVPSALWLRLRIDQLWVANEVDSLGSGWDATIVPVGRSRQGQVGTWLETPRTSPARVFLPGMRTGMSEGELRNGNEIFLPICALMYGGTKTALLSRWPTGGRSASTLLQRYLEELQDERPSAAWRRAVLAQWPERFPLANEPALLPAGKDASPLSSGAHPLLWSGYMSVGDYNVQK